MKTAHLMYVPFTGLGNKDRGDEWLKQRIKIFKSFVLTSLTAQIDKNFVIWISWRPKDENNPIIKEFFQYLNGIDGMTIIFTYDGLCFYDDKYEDEIAKKRLLNSLTRTLPQLKPHVDWADEVLMTIQPSDDMYMRTFARLIRKIEFKKVAGFRKGYIINYANKDIAYYNPETIPPFFTIKFPTEIFLDPQKHFDYTGPYKSHEYVDRIGDFKELPGRGFIVGTHDSNISTTWNIPYKGETLKGIEKEFVWLQSGIVFIPPIKVRNTLLLRKIYNRLPFKGLIKKIYYAFNKKETLSE